MLTLPRSLLGLRVLLTGASSGIGADVGAQLAGRGCRVAGTGRCASALALAPKGPLSAAIARDLTQPGAAAEVVAAATGALGGLDVVISNAGAGWSGPFESMEPDEIDAMVDINLRAPMHLAHAAAPYLLGSPGGGQLVLVGSIAGLVGVAGEAAYATAKAGLRGLADSLRAEWPAVTITLVSPGPVQTPFARRRNQPYARTWPKPLPVKSVSHAIVDAVEHRHTDVVVPAWMGTAARLNGGFPGLYRALAEVAGRLGGVARDGRTAPATSR
ncbi:MAG: SDR family NAD(P)-dependent oxidoreductase [Acidimicrobiales bacterium]